MKTIYNDIMTECPANFVGHHETDLYILKNEQTTKIIERYYKLPSVMAVTFYDQTTKMACYDIPFGYDPKWIEIEKKCNKSRQ